MGAYGPVFDRVNDSANQASLILQILRGIVVVVLLSQHHQIDSSLESLDGGVNWIVIALHRVHIHAVGDNQAIEAQFAPQQIAQNHGR